MKFSIFITFSTLCLFIVSCKSNPSEPNLSSEHKTGGDSLPLLEQGSSIYENAAIEICHCMHPMVEKAQKMEHLLKDKQKEASIEKEESELQNIRLQVESCSTNIRQKYGDMSSPSDQRLMLKALKDYCPESYKIISKGISLRQ